MRVSRKNESLRIKVGNRELKAIDHFKYLGSMLTRDGFVQGKSRSELPLPKKYLTEKCHS